MVCCFSICSLFQPFGITDDPFLDAHEERLHQPLEVVHKLLHRSAVLIQQPSFDGADDAVHHEIIDHLWHIVLLQQLRDPQPQNGLQKLPEVGSEGILSLHRQHPPVELPVVIEVAAVDLQTLPSLVEGGAGFGKVQIVLLHQYNELCVEDPVDQIVLVPEMVVEALAVHAPPVADVGNADLLKGLLRQQLLQGVGKGQFGNVGIRHSLFSYKKARLTRFVQISLVN